VGRTCHAEQLSNRVVATVGADVAVSVGRHVALLAVGRLYPLKDDDRQADGVLPRGVSFAIVRFGGGLRYRF
jgi:hypothetical protein